MSKARTGPVATPEPRFQGLQMLPRHYVEGFRRERIAAAVAEVAHEHGIAGATGVRIIARAHMARNTFYDLFESRDECLHFAFGEAYARLFGPLEASSEANSAWLTRLTIALKNLLTVSHEAPLTAELCLIHSWGAPCSSQGYDFQAGVGALAKLIAGGWDAEADAAGGPQREPSPSLEDLLAGAVLSLLARRVRRRELANLPALLGQLVALMAGPFIGLEEAARYGSEMASEW